MVRIALLLGIAITGCGSESSHSGGDKAAQAPTAPPPATQSYHSLAVQDAAALPACTPEAEGWLVYVKAETAFKTCTAGAWEAIDVKGERGADGAANKVTSVYTCGGRIPATTTAVSFRRVEMNSGDAFASAAVTAGSVQASASAFLPAAEATAGLVIQYDVSGDPNFGNWTISMEAAKMQVTAVYEDVDLPNGKETWILPETDCAKQDY